MKMEPKKSTMNNPIGSIIWGVNVWLRLKRFLLLRSSGLGRQQIPVFFFGWGDPVGKGVASSQPQDEMKRISKSNGQALCTWTPNQSAVCHVDFFLVGLKARGRICTFVPMLIEKRGEQLMPGQRVRENQAFM